MLDLVATNLGPLDHHHPRVTGDQGGKWGGGATTCGDDQHRVGDLVQIIFRECICQSQEKNRIGAEIKVTTRNGSRGFIDSTQETYRAQTP